MRNVYWDELVACVGCRSVVLVDEHTVLVDGVMVQFTAPIFLEVIHEEALREPTLIVEPMIQSGGG